MSTLKLPAARVRQGDLTLFTTSLKVRDLLVDGFYSVDTLDPEDEGNGGYQRLLNKARAKKLAEYVVAGQDSKDAFLPTSVFLATHQTIDFNSDENTILIDTVKVTPFSVVDGQHRIEGLRMAAEKDPRVLDFEIPVNIAIKLSSIEQMCHFLIVNTSQKSVDKGVEQRIYARLTAGLDVEDLPSLPRWVLSTVQKGEIEKALKYVDYLNQAEGSPWYGKIQVANKDSDSATINQKSFVKAVVRYVLTANNPLAALKDFDKEKKIFANYWKAIAAILDDGTPSLVLYKSTGVELFCKFSIPFFTKLIDQGNFRVDVMEDLLRGCFENMDGENAGIGHTDWWKRGSRASGLNGASISVVSSEMAKALHKTSMGSAAIQL